MKLLPVLLWSGIHSGRPSSHGVLFATELNDEENVEAAEADVCVPQNTPQAADWKRPCITKGECCSKRITKTASFTGGGHLFVCGCIPAGEYAHGNAANCCAGKLDPKKKKRCGCIDPDVGPQQHLAARFLKLDRDDCCYVSQLVQDESPPAVYKRQEFQKSDFENCGPRVCAAPGTSSHKAAVKGLGQPAGKIGGLLTARAPGHKPSTKTECCGGTTAVKVAFFDICKCIPTGTRLRPRLETVSPSMCCSGSVVNAEAVEPVCDCIPGGQLLPGDASPTDCCKGRVVTEESGKYCENEQCIKPHDKRDKMGDICCTDPDNGPAKELAPHVTEAHNRYCGCLKGGTKVDKGKETWCCSRTRTSDGKCGWVGFKEHIHLDYMTEAECFSGKADDDECLCMKPGSSLRGDIDHQDKFNCCSGGLDTAETRCSCIHAGGHLRAGSNVSDCCSELADPERSGYCTCGPIGAPYSKPKKALGMNPSIDCCSGTARGNFCACIAAGAVKKGNSSNCCGEQEATALQCGCKLKGAVVDPGATGKDVCCSHSSEKITEDGCEFEKCK